MRAIKIVVSDFHMGEGRILPDGSVNNLEDFISDQAFIDLMEYYRAISPWLLPYLKDRLLVLTRFPDGRLASSFRDYLAP